MEIVLGQIGLAEIFSTSSFIEGVTVDFQSTLHTLDTIYPLNEFTKYTDRDPFQIKAPCVLVNNSF
jgi:hypothetical protein